MIRYARHFDTPLVNPFRPGNQTHRLFLTRPPHLATIAELNLVDTYPANAVSSCRAHCPEHLESLRVPL